MNAIEFFTGSKESSKIYQVLPFFMGIETYKCKEFFVRSEFIFIECLEYYSLKSNYHYNLRPLLSGLLRPMV